MKRNLKIMIFAHAGSLNRGCDALLRTISYQLKRNIDKPKIIVVSDNVKQDKNAGQVYVDKYLPVQRRKQHPVRLYASFLRRVGFKRQIVDRIKYDHIIRNGQAADVGISIGGDNYFKKYNKYQKLYAIDEAIYKAGKKLILWGCSIEADEIDSDMEKDLKRFSLILARESITYNTLLERNINKNTFLCADPAFTMPKEILTLPDNWQEGIMIGLNISPLIINYENFSGILFKATCDLISHILKTTECNVALIPHVTWQTNNDLVPLGRLYENFKNTNRVVLLGDDGFNAPQLKGFIARCRMFIGARTHSVIAAYSTNVPTLALGYSVKAHGIARDLFGDERGLVIPVQKLENEKQLINAFDSLKEREEELRKHLKQVIPAYAASSEQAVKHVKKLL
jgi:colanic acid/amylovoran biosynthesis protein